MARKLFGFSLVLSCFGLHGSDAVWTHTRLPDSLPYGAVGSEILHCSSLDVFVVVGGALGSSSLSLGTDLTPVAFQVIPTSKDPVLKPVPIVQSATEQASPNGRRFHSAVVVRDSWSDCYFSVFGGEYRIDDKWVLNDDLWVGSLSISNEADGSNLTSLELNWVSVPLGKEERRSNLLAASSFTVEVDQVSNNARCETSNARLLAFGGGYSMTAFDSGLFEVRFTIRPSCDKNEDDLGRRKSSQVIRRQAAFSIPKASVAVESIKPGGTEVPEPRFAHAGAGLRDAAGKLTDLVVAGGRGSSESEKKVPLYNDVWIFNLRESSWRRMQAGGNKDSSQELGRTVRQMYSCSATLQNHLLLYGGFSSVQLALPFDLVFPREDFSLVNPRPSSDLKLCSNRAFCTWNQNFEGRTPREAPDALRAVGCTVFNGNKLLMVGGLNKDNEPSMQAWVFDFTSKSSQRNEIYTADFNLKVSPSDSFYQVVRDSDGSTFDEPLNVGSAIGVGIAMFVGCVALMLLYEWIVKTRCSQSWQH